MSLSDDHHKVAQNIPTDLVHTSTIPITTDSIIVNSPGSDDSSFSSETSSRASSTSVSSTSTEATIYDPSNNKGLSNQYHDHVKSYKLSNTPIGSLLNVSQFNLHLLHHFVNQVYPIFVRGQNGSYKYQFNDVWLNKVPILFNESKLISNGIMSISSLNLWYLNNNFQNLSLESSSSLYYDSTLKLYRKELTCLQLKLLRNNNNIRDDAENQYRYSILFLSSVIIYSFSIHHPRLIPLVSFNKNSYSNIKSSTDSNKSDAEEVEEVEEDDDHDEIIDLFTIINGINLIGKLKLSDLSKTFLKPFIFNDAILIRKKFIIPESFNFPFLRLLINKFKEFKEKSFYNYNLFIKNDNHNEISINNNYDISVNEEIEIYNQSIIKLKRSCYDSYKVNCSVYIFRWIFIIDPKFQILLKQKNPFSLLLLSYYCVLLQLTKHYLSKDENIWLNFINTTRKIFKDFGNDDNSNEMILQMDWEKELEIPLRFLRNYEDFVDGDFQKILNLPID